MNWGNQGRRNANIIEAMNQRASLALQPLAVAGEYLARAWRAAFVWLSLISDTIIVSRLASMIMRVPSPQFALPKARG